MCVFLFYAYSYPYYVFRFCALLISFKESFGYATDFTAITMLHKIGCCLEEMAMYLSNEQAIYLLDMGD